MAGSRAVTIIEMGGRGYVVTPVWVDPHVADWQVVFCRRDGTEPVVVTGRGDWVGCSCGGEECRHYRALARAGCLPEVSRSPAEARRQARHARGGALGVFGRIMRAVMESLPGKGEDRLDELEVVEEPRVPESHRLPHRHRRFL